MADKSSQTEKATPQHLKKAREEGRFPAAKEFVNALQFAAFVYWLGSSGPEWVTQLRITAQLLLNHAFNHELSLDSLRPMSIEIATHCFLPLGKLFLLLMGTTFAMTLFVTGFGFTTKRLMPDFTRLSPGSRLKEIPSQNMSALVQAALMLPIFSYVVYSIIKSHLGEYLSLPGQSFSSSLHIVSGSILNLLWKAVFVFVIFGCVNFAKQRRKYNKDLMMSKQDIKDEHKSTEGNPMIKSRVRRLQRDMRRRNMMKEIPNATAVIVNPTHYAIAIRYHVSSMAAPLVIAKGKNYLALRIRKRALEHQIPIIENPPLAQALYKSADVGQEVPAHLYRAVAEVLAYIYRIMNGRMPGQQ